MLEQLLLVGVVQRLLLVGLIFTVILDYWSIILLEVWCIGLLFHWNFGRYFTGSSLVFCLGGPMLIMLRVQ
jgi:hypothetical protein